MVPMNEDKSEILGNIQFKPTIESTGGGLLINGESQDPHQSTLKTPANQGSSTKKRFYYLCVFYIHFIDIDLIFFNVCPVPGSFLIDSKSKNT